MDPSVDTIKCTYKLGDSLEKSPHIHEPFRPHPKKIFDDAGHNHSLDEIRHLLEVVSAPSTDINITNDEFYYIMTQKPAKVDLVNAVIKQ